jgi:ABC-type antimicrobial peptide transport system permease subunit
MFYIPYAQADPDRFDEIHFEARVASTLAISPAIVRRIARQVDPELVISDARFQTEQIQESLVNERILSRLATLFGGFALLVSCIGIYGTVSHTVTSRRREIGIQMALGANRSHVFLSVVQETARLAVLGSILGIALSLAIGRYLNSIVYGISPTNLFLAICACGALLLSSVCAVINPAVKAAGVDPYVAIRSA